ncbi:MAG: flagellar hook-basal body complex protein, partial [Vallitaleaceae bacterium]|nr:flagellar hook-basal body complex protein [Vallitaleaceae bacterium]
TKLLGQLVIATFQNPAGLQKVGDNLFQATNNSGEFDGIGSDVTSNGGSFNSGVLEMSNVDLSKEFTEMITTQRGFQANSRIITSSDEMLQELVNLKR